MKISQCMPVLSLKSPFLVYFLINIAAYMKSGKSWSKTYIYT